MLAVGIFAAKDRLEGFSRYDGLVHGGGFYLLGVQLLACVCCSIWASSVTFILIYVSQSILESCFYISIPWQLIDKIIPFRMTEHEELIGADYMEHNIHHPDVGVTRAVSVIKKHDKHVDLGLTPVGKNKGKTFRNDRHNIIVSLLVTGHMEYLEKYYASRLTSAIRSRSQSSKKNQVMADETKF